MTHKKGFSFIELLVVIGIITVISSVALVSFGVLGGRTKLTAATNVVYDTAKKTRHNSISVKEFKTNLFPSYGIYFDMSFPEKIIVYADCITNDRDTAQEIAEGRAPIVNENDDFDYDQANCAGGNLVEEITLPYGAKIKEMRYISAFGPSGTQQKIFMEFLRPEPTIWITLEDGSLLPAGRIEIDITDATEKLSKTVIFRSTGQFSIE